MDLTVVEGLVNKVLTFNPACHSFQLDEGTKLLQTVDPTIVNLVEDWAFVQLSTPSPSPVIPPTIITSATIRTWTAPTRGWGTGVRASWTFGRTVIVRSAWSCPLRRAFQLRHHVVYLLHDRVFGDGGFPFPILQREPRKQPLILLGLVQRGSVATVHLARRSGFLLVLWMEGEDETVDILDERLGETGANFLQLRLEFWEGFGLVMKGDDELGKCLVAQPSVVVDLLSDFGDQREELKVVEIIFSHDGRSERDCFEALGDADLWAPITKLGSTLFVIGHTWFSSLLHVYVSRLKERLHELLSG